MPGIDFTTVRQRITMAEVLGRLDSSRRAFAARPCVVPARCIARQVRGAVRFRYTWDWAATGASAADRGETP